MNYKLGDLVTAVAGLGIEDIIYPDPSIMYTGIVIDKIKIETGNDDLEYSYEIFCQDGKVHKFYSREVLDPFTLK